MYLALWDRRDPPQQVNTGLVGAPVIAGIAQDRAQSERQTPTADGTMITDQKGGKYRWIAPPYDFQNKNGWKSNLIF